MNGFFDFSIQYGAEGFGLYKAGHFIWLAIFAAMTAALSLIYRRASVKGRRALRFTVAFTALFLELLRAALLMRAGEYTVFRLPLHLCALAVYIGVFHALTGGRLTGQFLCAFCMPGALCALLFPDWTYYPFIHFMTLSSFILHILLVDYTLMQIFGGELRPDIRRAPACLGIMLLLAAPVYALNKLWGTNYMFLNWPSEGSPLEWFAFLGRPGYLAGYLPLLAAAWAPIYLPGIIKRLAEKRHKKQ